MTVRDVENLSYVELESLMDGMSKNSERERKMIENVQETKGDATDFMKFMMENG